MFECGPAAVAAARISRQQRRRAGESESLHYNRRRPSALLSPPPRVGRTHTHPFSMPSVGVTQLSSLRAEFVNGMVMVGDGLGSGGVCQGSIMCEIVVNVGKGTRQRVCKILSFISVFNYVTTFLEVGSGGNLPVQYFCLFVPVYYCRTGRAASRSVLLCVNRGRQPESQEMIGLVTRLGLLVLKFSLFRPLALYATDVK